jgi:hypothetical protein
MWFPSKAEVATVDEVAVGQAEVRVHLDGVQVSLCVPYKACSSLKLKRVIKFELMATFEKTLSETDTPATLHRVRAKPLPPFKWLEMRLLMATSCLVSCPIYVTTLQV